MQTKDESIECRPAVPWRRHIDLRHSIKTLNELVCVFIQERAGVHGFVIFAGVLSGGFQSKAVCILILALSFLTVSDPAKGEKSETID